MTDPAPFDFVSIPDLDLEPEFNFDFGRFLREVQRSAPRKRRRQPCGARTRKGTPCKAMGLEPSGRCRFHGGLSTGPKTPEGRARALANLRQYRSGEAPDLTEPDILPP